MMEELGIIRVSLLHFLSELLFAYLHACVDPSLRRAKDIARMKGHPAAGAAMGLVVSSC